MFFFSKIMKTVRGISLAPVMSNCYNGYMVNNNNNLAREFVEMEQQLVCTLLYGVVEGLVVEASLL